MCNVQTSAEWGSLIDHCLECIWDNAMYRRSRRSVIGMRGNSDLRLFLTEEPEESKPLVTAVYGPWYEYSDFWSKGFDCSLEFDAYIIPQSEVGEGVIRLLDTNIRPVLPYLVQTRVLITRLDVLHCWTVPSLGVKVDAAPGRINQVKFFTYQPGVFYGQCSEICGANHRFIPIALEFFRTEIFLNWIDINSQ